MMAMDIPAQATVSLIDINQIGKVVQDYGPVLASLKQVLDAQTLEGLKEGKVSVPESVANEALAKAMAEKGGEASLEFLDKNRLRLTMQTEGYGRVRLKCRIDSFVHNDQTSEMKLTVTDKSLPDRPLLSWAASLVSTGLLAKWSGTPDLGSGVVTEIHGNEITINFREALYQSDFGKAQLLGYSILDRLQIDSATARQGAVDFAAKLDVPEEILERLAALTGKQNS